MKCALVIGGKVYVAWKHKMLHDVIGGYQAYIQRKIYVLHLEFGSWLRPRVVCRLRARFARDKIIKSLRSVLRAVLLGNINSFSSLFCIVNFPSYLRTVNIKDLVYMHSNINFINISILVT